VKGGALTPLTPSEVTRLLEPFKNHTGGPIVRCYYCSRGGSTETTVLADGHPVSGWVCVEHAAHPPKRTGGVSTRLRRIALLGSNGGNSAHLPRWR
jgi:hypothetical protein